MAVTVKHMASILSAFGITSFILGVIAENKKKTIHPMLCRGENFTHLKQLYDHQPAAGIPVPSNDGVSVTCQYPSNPTVVLGFLSVIFLIASTITGYMSLYYPYKGKAIPQGALSKHTTFTVFFNIALFTTGLAGTFLLWPTITEHIHLTRNVHRDINYVCPTAKTGVLGGGAFLSLDSSMFWLIALMLADNARDDYFEEQEENKGE